MLMRGVSSSSCCCGMVSVRVARLLFAIYVGICADRYNYCLFFKLRPDSFLNKIILYFVVLHCIALFSFDYCIIDEVICSQFQLSLTV